MEKDAVAFSKIVETETHHEISLSPALVDSGESKVCCSKAGQGVCLEKWNGEAAMTVRYEALKDATANVLSDRVEWKGKKQSVHVYTLQPSTIMEDGGLEIEIFLAEKPDSNEFQFLVDGAEDLDFFYQPELTQAEIDFGASRRENVVGSYAVYHKTKRDNRPGAPNYATGKAYHIFRPKATDANGKEIWCDLKYAIGILTVIVPQDFLEGGAYPVIVDPTFGYTSIGATTNSGAGDAIQGNGTSSPATSGNANSVSMYIGNSTNNATFGIYDSTPTNLLKDGAGGAVTANGWNTRDLDSALAVTAGTNYYLCWNHNGVMDTKYDVGTNTLKFKGSTYSAGTLPATFGTPDQTIPLLTWSIYATYTEPSFVMPMLDPQQNAMLMR